MTRMNFSLKINNHHLSNLVHCCFSSHLCFQFFIFIFIFRRFSSKPRIETSNGLWSCPAASSARKWKSGHQSPDRRKQLAVVLGSQSHRGGISGVSPNLCSPPHLRLNHPSQALNIGKEACPCRLAFSRSDRKVVGWSHLRAMVNEIKRNHQPLFL